MPIVQEGSQNYYETSFTTTFAETNVVGNIYFAHYVLWQGKCRELFLAEVCPEILRDIQSGLALVTLDVSCNFLDQLHALQRVVMRMVVEDMSANRVLLGFDYLRQEGDKRTLVCRSHQSFASMRKVDGVLKPVSIPAPLVDSVREYGLMATAAR